MPGIDKGDQLAIILAVYMKVTLTSPALGRAAHASVSKHRYGCLDINVKLVS